MKTNKQYFFYYLKDNILVFDVFDYIEEISADFVDYLNDWSLIKNNKASCKDKIIKEYFEQCISLAEVIMNDKSNKLNCKILCFYREKQKLNQWSNFFIDPLKVLKIAKKVIKKKLNNFIEIKHNGQLFQTIKGTMSGIPVIIPSGEDEEFLIKVKKKLKTPIDKYTTVE
jgi:hypothetical protein